MAKKKSESIEVKERQYLEICLNNRYRDNNKLIQSVWDETKFYLIFSNEDDASYCRVIYPEGVHDYESKEYFAVDPSGGPFMSIGLIIKVEDTFYKVIRITAEDRDESEPALLGRDFLKKPFVLYMEKLDQIDTDNVEHVMIPWKYKVIEYSKVNLTVKDEKEKSVIDLIKEETEMVLKKNKEKEKEKEMSVVIYVNETNSPIIYNADVEVDNNEYIMTSTETGKSYKAKGSF